MVVVVVTTVVAADAVVDVVIDIVTFSIVCLRDFLRLFNEPLAVDNGVSSLTQECVELSEP